MKVKTVAGHLKYGLYLIFHPFDGFWDIKHEKKAGMPAVIIILALFILLNMAEIQFKGFLLLEQFYKDNTLLVTEMSKVVLPFAMWVVSSWCLTTLLDGEGSLKDIAVATAYCLIPVILVKLPAILVSNVITGDEVAFLNILNGVSYFWAGFLLFVSVVVTQQYTVPKALITILFSVVAIGILLFLSMLVVTLVQHIYNFFSIIYLEVSLRLL